MISNSASGAPDALGMRLCRMLDLRRFRYLFLFLSAVLTALTLIFTELWLLQWLSLVPAILVVFSISEASDMRVRDLYRYGLLFFWMFYIVVFHWFLAMYPLPFTGLSKGAAAVVSLLGVFGLSLLQALFSGWGFVLFYFTANSRVVGRLPFLRPFLFAAIWTALEWFQTLGWWGVPWGRLAIGQIDALVTVQTAEWFGSYFVSFLLLAVNACVAYALLYADLKRIASITACGIFLLNLLSGSFLLYADRDEGESVTVAAVQGNIENKWDFGILKEIETVYREYTLVAAKNGAEIVVWPETALPVDLLTTPSLMKYAQDLAKEANVTLIIGSFHAKETEDGEYLDHNSLFMISPDGTLSETVYDKQHLVPFGEYVPMRSLIEFVFPPLADVGMLEGDLGRGVPGVNFSTEYGEIGCMICFDSIYEDVAISAVRNGAEILCLASNDAWFLDSAAIYMHHDQARLRAIETSRYLVRAGNSGITSVISPSGKVLSEIEPMTEGYVLSQVTVRTDRTLYSYIGNAFVYLLLAGIGVLLCVSAFDAIAARHQTASEKKEC